MKKMAKVKPLRRGGWMIRGIIGARIYRIADKRTAMRKYADECRIQRAKKELI